MMEWRHDFSEGVANGLEPLMSRASSKEELRRIQAIYFRARFKDTAEMVALRTGLSLGTVRNLHSRWRQDGEAALELRKKGGRYHAYMSLEEERAWLHDTFGKDAIAGGILEVGKIKRAYEARIGREVYPTTIYDLLHRHGWRKIAPRPRHPKADIEAQETFKKTGRQSSKKQNRKPV